MTRIASPTLASRSQEFVRPGFRSFKTVYGPIPYLQRWHRDLLVLATLDHAIETIIKVVAQEEEQFSLKLRIAGVDRCAIAIRDEYASLCIPPESIIIPRSFVLAEPRCSTSRMVWSTRNIMISPGNRLRILMELSKTPDGIEIGLLSSALRALTPNPTEAILSLACAGQMTIDLTRPFSPDTIVCPRSATIETGLKSLPVAIGLSPTMPRQQSE